MAIGLDYQPSDLVVQRPSLVSLCQIFLRIACVSFGGYMVMISAMHNAIVERRKLLSEQDLLNGVSLASIMPGPVALNVVAYVGYRLRGGAGALVCVSAAVMPGFLLMLLLTMAYLKWGHIPAIDKIFLGVIPAVTAIIMSAAWTTARKSVISLREGILAFAAATALLSIGGLYVTLAIIVVAAMAGWYWFDVVSINQRPVIEEKTFVNEPGPFNSHFSVGFALLTGAAVPFATFDPHVLLKLFATFASMSMLLFGGAYVFVPLLQQTVVDAHGWVTQRQFIDAVAMGQMMPGPVVVSAAFIGFKVAGLAGAFVAMLGIVMPSAVAMVWCTRMLDGFIQSKKVNAALRGIRAAVVGMIFAAAISIGLAAKPGWIAVVIFVVVAGLLLRRKIEAIWLVPFAGLTGFLLY